MPQEENKISGRKKDHIEICLTDEAAFRGKTTGFEKYDFIHDALTEVKLDEIDLSQNFLDKQISYPFLISSMTGGTIEAESINAQLAEAANYLNIPVGVGSQRQMLDDHSKIDTYKIIKEKAPNVPKLGNIGAAQVAKMGDVSDIQFLADVIDAAAMVIHLNPLQELIQPEGETDFAGLLKNIFRCVSGLSVPVIVKEVGAGISKSAAEKLLDSGVYGIDAAGAGGTSWAGVEMKRKNDSGENAFWDWGLPTSYCIKEIAKLKNEKKFILIGSGGITDGFEAAKALALGADIAASARPLLQSVVEKGFEGLVNKFENWIDTLKKIMFLTGSKNLNELRKNKIIKKEELF